MSLSFRLLPGCCLLCGQRTFRARDLCRSCEADLPFHDHSCVRCGLPVHGKDNVCGSCLKAPPPQEVFHAPFRYAFPLDGVIQRFKFNQDHAAGRLLGELLVDHLRVADRPDCVIPVPLHPRRQRERGFNQAEILFAPVARHLRLPLRTDLVARSRETAVQSGMNAAARRRNVKDAFAITRTMLPAHVAIVDDVVTTGSTCREIAKLLKGAGVGRVDVWALARTVSD